MEPAGLLRSKFQANHIDGELIEPLLQLWWLDDFAEMWVDGQLFCQLV